MNVLEKLIVLDERIKDLQQALIRSHYERDIVYKCLMTAIKALADVVNEELTGKAAEKRVSIALDTIEVLCSPTTRS